MRGDEDRRHISADEAKTAQRRPVLQRGRQRRKGHRAEKQEGKSRGEEMIERVGRPDVGVGAGRACGGENARDVRLRRQLVEPSDDLAATRQFSEPDEYGS